MASYDWREGMSFILATKNTKHLRIKLTGNAHTLYEENC
jgi:hypothetical protein